MDSCGCLYILSSSRVEKNPNCGINGNVRFREPWLCCNLMFLYVATFSYLGSIFNFILRQHCAYDLVRFVYKDNFVKVKKIML